MLRKKEESTETEEKWMKNKNEILEGPRNWKRTRPKIKIK